MQTAQTCSVIYRIFIEHLLPMSSRYSCLRKCSVIWNSALICASCRTTNLKHFISCHGGQILNDEINKSINLGILFRLWPLLFLLVTVWGWHVCLRFYIPKIQKLVIHPFVFSKYDLVINLVSFRRLTGH
jgi:hypothetical protein